MFCTSCGSANPDGNKFCTVCGHPLELTTPIAEKPDSGKVHKTDKSFENPGHKVPPIPTPPPIMPPKVEIPKHDTSAPGPQVPSSKPEPFPPQPQAPAGHPQQFSTKPDIQKTKPQSFPSQSETQNQKPQTFSPQPENQVPKPDFSRFKSQSFSTQAESAPTEKPDFSRFKSKPFAPQQEVTPIKPQSFSPQTEQDSQNPQNSSTQSQGGTSSGNPTVEEFKAKFGKEAILASQRFEEPNKSFWKKPLPYIIGGVLIALIVAAIIVFNPSDSQKDVDSDINDELYSDNPYNSAEFQQDGTEQEGEKVARLTPSESGEIPPAVKTPATKAETPAKETAAKQPSSPSEASTPTPKVETPAPAQTSTHKLSYGSWTGGWKNGQPHGTGTLTYSSAQTIDSRDSKGRVAQPGEYIIGEWDNGHLVQGRWFKNDGTKEAVIIGKAG